MLGTLSALSRVRGSPVYVGTWANRPAAASFAAGSVMWITDLGAGQYTTWRTNGVSWNLTGPQDFLFDLTPSVGVTGTSEQILKQYTFQAGLLQALRCFSVKVLLSKSGSTDIATLQLRLGTAGTTSDQSLLSTSNLTAVNLSYTIEYLGAATSATQIRRVGTQTGLSAFPNTATGTAYPQNTTVSDVSANAMILSGSITMNGSTNTPTLGHMIITGY
jgi:hypothetical protein